MSFPSGRVSWKLPWFHNNCLYLDFGTFLPLRLTLSDISLRIQSPLLPKISCFAHMELALAIYFREMKEPRIEYYLLISHAIISICYLFALKWWQAFNNFQSHVLLQYRLITFSLLTLWIWTHIPHQLHVEHLLFPGVQINKYLSICHILNDLWLLIQKF